MPGLGTLINVVTVLVGGALGLLLGTRLPQRVRETIMHAVGLLTLVLGVKLALETSNILIVLGSLLLGGIVGELLRIEERLDRLGRWFEGRAAVRAQGVHPGEISNPAVSGASRFSHAFLSASLLFCVGPMTILGSIQDGLNRDYSLLAIKATLDGFSALAFASTLGPGVMLSAATVLLYQGALTAAAGWASRALSAPMIAEMTATGGALMLALGLGLLEIKRIRVGNLLPALMLAPLIVAAVGALGG